MQMNPAQKINPIIRAFITSEFFFWSAWNSITPIFTVFVMKGIDGSNIAIATSAYSFHLVVRIATELLIGKKFPYSKDRVKIFITLLGLVIISIAYIGLAFTRSIQAIFLFFGLIGLGFGIASPAKLSLFSIHLDRKKETYEWSVYDAISMGGMAISAFLAGLIIHEWGFQTMFALAALINFIGILPYLLLL